LNPKWSLFCNENGKSCTFLKKKLENIWRVLKFAVPLHPLSDKNESKRKVIFENLT